MFDVKTPLLIIIVYLDLSIYCTRDNSHGAQPKSDKPRMRWCVAGTMRAGGTCTTSVHSTATAYNIRR